MAAMANTRNEQLIPTSATPVPTVHEWGVYHGRHFSAAALEDLAYQRGMRRLRAGDDPADIVHMIEVYLNRAATLRALPRPGSDEWKQARG